MTPTRCMDKHCHRQREEWDHSLLKLCEWNQAILGVCDRVFAIRVVGFFQQVCEFWGQLGNLFLNL